MHVERHAAEPAGAQGFDQCVAVDDRGVRDVDDAGAGLDLRKLGAADQVARDGTVGSCGTIQSLSASSVGSGTWRALNSRSSASGARVR